MQYHSHDGSQNSMHHTAPHSSQWVLLWQLAISEEYHVKLVYYKGELKAVENGLLRVPFKKYKSKVAFQELFALKSSNPDGNKLFLLNLHKIPRNINPMSNFLSLNNCEPKLTNLGNIL